MEEQLPPLTKPSLQSQIYGHIEELWTIWPLTLENLRSVVASFKLSFFLKMKGWGFFGRRRLRDAVLEGTRKVTPASYIPLQAASLLERQLLPPQAINPLLTPEIKSLNLKDWKLWRLHHISRKAVVSHASKLKKNPNKPTQQQQKNTTTTTTKKPQPNTRA